MPSTGFRNQGYLVRYFHPSHRILVACGVIAPYQLARIKRNNNITTYSEHKYHQQNYHTVVTGCGLILMNSLLGFNTFVCYSDGCGATCCISLRDFTLLLSIPNFKCTVCVHAPAQFRTLHSGICLRTLLLANHVEFGFPWLLVTL